MFTIKSVEQNVNNLCKISVKPIECKSESELKERSKFKCFWPKCRFETTAIYTFNSNTKSIHLNERQFVCDFIECNKTFKFKNLI